MPRADGVRRRRPEPFGRYDDLPPSALLAQLFLATGWARAAVAHGVDPAWWSGAEVKHFVRDDTAYSLALYRPVLDLVEAVPVLAAAIVMALQCVAAVTFGLNRRVTLGIGAGLFLNLHFVAAGAVNPSVFYLMLTGVLIAARLERSFATTAPVLRKRSRWFAAAAVVVLGPNVRSIAPDAVIEDPALVLLYAVAISTLVLHIAWPRRSHFLADRTERRTIDLRD